MTTVETKKCRVCEINQPVSNYHTNRGHFKRTECGSCRNNSHRKPKAFDRLTSSQVADIKKRISEGQIKSKVGRKYGIKPGTLYYWIRSGKL